MDVLLMQGSICPVLPVRPLRQPSRRNHTRTRASCTLKAFDDYANERKTMKTRIMEGLACTERRVISFAAVSMLVLVLGVPTPVGAEEVIAGNARVVDGDTIEIDKRRIRLYAIDAPEMKQSCSNNKKEYKCGVASKAALEKKIGSKPVRCEPKKSRDRYGRYVATCFIENKSKNEMEDLNAWMVARGHAVAYRRYGKIYVKLEENAKAHQLGIWNGSFENPEVWRAQQRTGSSSGKQCKS